MTTPTLLQRVEALEKLVGIPLDRPKPTPAPAFPPPAARCPRCMVPVESLRSYVCHRSDCPTIMSAKS